jgi:hypothetical protein
MASLTLWPAIGVTVYAADGTTLITSAGVLLEPLPLDTFGVPYVPEYYQRRIAQGVLLTQNPLGESSGPPVSLPGGGGTGGSGSSAGVTYTINAFAGGEVLGTSVQAADALIFTGLTADRTITGIDWSASGASVKSIINADATRTLTIAHDGSVTTSRQVLTGTGVGVVVRPGKGSEVSYDTAGGKYRCPVYDADRANSAETAVSAESLPSATLASLSAPPGGTSSAHAFSVGGRDSIGDGGGGDWDYMPSSSATVIPGLIESFGTGRRVRRRDWSSRVNIRWIGCKADGSTDCAALINAFIGNRIADLGSAYACNVNLLVPYVDDRQAGYLLGSTIAPGQGVALDIRGEGRPYIEAFSFAQSSSAARRHGSVFLSPAGVTPFGSISTGYQFLHLEDIGLLGTGTGNTGHGISAHSPAGNFQLTGRNVWAAGYDRGFYLRNVISSHGMFAFKAHGCQVGFQLGEPGGYGPFDCEMFGFDAEYNRLGVKIVQVFSSRWYGGLVQSNGNGIEWGDAAGGGNVRCFTMLPGPHMEINGPNIDYGLSTPYEWRINDTAVGAGNTYSNVEIRQLFAASGASVTVPGGTWSFHNCEFNGSLTVNAGSVVQNLSGVPLGGFTSIALDANARYVPGRAIYPVFANTVGATYQHDWAASGEHAELILSTNITISAPAGGTYCSGAFFELFMRQPSTGGCTVTFSGVYLARPWSDAGNSGSSYARIAFRFDNGVWAEVYRTAWGGFDESTVASVVAPDERYRADSVTAANGRTTELVSSVNSAHKLTVFGGASVVPPALPETVPACNDQLAVRFNPVGGSGTQHGFASNRAASAYNYLRAGAFDIWLVARILAAPPADTVNMFLSTGGSGNIFDFYATSGNSYNFRNAPDTTLSGAANRLGYLQCVRMYSTTNGGYNVQISTPVGGYSYTIPPSGSALSGGVASALCLGLQPSTNSYPAVMDWCELVIKSSVLGTAAINTMWAYIANRYGLGRWSF